MSHRDNYKDGIPSVTDLLKWAGFYDGYPFDPDGYYFKRGKFVDQCCAILAAGEGLDSHTRDLAYQRREKPLTVVGEQKYESWWDYIWPFNEYLTQHSTTLIAAQLYVHNPWENYQGTLDLFWEVDGVLTLDDIKTGDCPKSTALQTAGYDMARNSKTRARRRGLQLLPGQPLELGKTIHPYPDFKDYDAFRLLCRWYWRSKDYQ